MAYSKTTWVNGETPINATNLNNIEDGIVGLSGKVLWNNTSWTSPFSAQTINLFHSLDEYDCYEIIYRQSISAGRMMNTGKIQVGYGTILGYATAYNTFRATTAEVSGNTITFEDAQFEDGTVNNNNLIPLYVIGYKMDIF